MSGPRFRQHADGRVAVHAPTSWAPDRWDLVHGYDPAYCDGYADAEVHGEGWSEAVLVVLPPPEDVQPVCGCAIPPDGAVTTAQGCCRECNEPALAFFPGGISLDLQAGARLQAARLLSAVALWEAAGEHRESPEVTP